VQAETAEVWSPRLLELEVFLRISCDFVSRKQNIFTGSIILDAAMNEFEQFMGRRERIRVPWDLYGFLKNQKVMAPNGFPTELASQDMFLF
jgi:hypothetical protein